MPADQDPAASALAMHSMTGTSRAVMLLRHGDEAAAEAAVDVLAQLSADSQLAPFIDAACRLPADDAGLLGTIRHYASLLERGQRHQVDLLDLLAGLGSLDRFDVVTVCTAGLSAAQQTALADAEVSVRHDLQRVMPLAVPLAFHRLWFPCFGDDGLAPAADYASSGTQSALVVLPEDRPTDRAAAKPLTSARASDAFAWHVAAEFAALTGLWSTLDHAPLESLVPAVSGSDQPLVRLVRSMCRTARIRMPSPAQLLDASGSLPVPVQLMPAPDPYHAAQAAADCLRPWDIAGGSAERVSLLPGWQGVGARLVAAGADVKLGSDEGTEQIAHHAPWAEPLLPRDGPPRVADDGTLEQVRVRLDRAIGPKVKLGTVPTSAWDAVLDDMFGVVDAGPRASVVQAAAAGAFDPVADPDAFSPDVSSLAQAVSMLTVASLRDTGLNDAAASPAMSDDAPADQQHGRPDADEDAAEPDGDQSEAADDDGTSDDDTVIDASTNAADHNTASDAPDPASLLQDVTCRFDEQIAEASSATDNAIAELDREISGQPRTGLSAFLKHAPWVAGLIAAAAVLTLTSARDWATPDGRGEVVRVALFGLVSLAATVPSVLRLMVGGPIALAKPKAAQVRLPLLAASYVGAFFVVWFSREFIAREVRRIDPDALGGVARLIPAAVVVSVVLVLALVSRNRVPADNKALLGKAGWLASGRAAFAALVAYVFVVVVAALNMDEVASALDQDTSAAFTVLLLSAAALAAVAVGLRLLAPRLNRTRLRVWQGQVCRRVDACELACVRSAALSLAKSHWLVTAAAAARLVHRPFGTDPATSQPDDPDSAVRKLSLLDVELAVETERDVLREFRREAVSPGWLREQFGRMSQAFMHSDQPPFGTGADGGLTPPEHCTEPMALASVLNGEGTGPRWRFAQRVFAGDYDSLLHESAQAAMYRAMEETAGSAVICEASGGAASIRRPLAEVLGELLPRGDTQLVSGALPLSTEPAPEFRSVVCWPKAVAVPEASATPTHRCGTVRERGTVLLHAVRVDVSEPVALDRLMPPARPDALVADGPADDGAGAAVAPSDPLDDPDAPLM